jgi:protoheme IX farnesyltransferase
VKVASDLVKARLTLMVVLTTWMGFSLGSPESSDGMSCVHAIIGTSLLAAGASALNQWWESDLDARMRRTASRPIPAGILTPLTVLAFGVAISIVGLAWLVFAVNLLTAFLGALTLATYVFLYTPLKQTTELNTWVGAIPGALPPLMGWTAATGQLGAGGWSLFAILFFWQLPHFMAIAWLYRDEYAQAGFRMLSGRNQWSHLPLGGAGAGWTLPDPVHPLCTPAQRHVGAAVVFRFNFLSSDHLGGPGHGSN